MYKYSTLDKIGKVFTNNEISPTLSATVVNLQR